MCAHDVVVEDVGAGPVCGCYQKFQTIQLFEKPFEVGDGAGDFEDAVVGAGAHVHALHGVTEVTYFSHLIIANISEGSVTSFVIAQSPVPISFTLAPSR